MRKTKSWAKRPPEAANLLNPAFCACLLYAFIDEYEMSSFKELEFPLLYLVLPLVLHKETRGTVNSRVRFLVWAKSHPECIASFAKRASAFVDITNEAIEFLLRSSSAFISDTGTIKVRKNVALRSTKKYTDREIRDCILKSRNIARWFARSGSAETIYAILGVRP